MKTKQEAKKEALAYVGELMDGLKYVGIDICKDKYLVETKTFPFVEPLEKDELYRVWGGDERPTHPKIMYYSGEGMNFYSYKHEHGAMYYPDKWKHFEKVEK